MAQQKVELRKIRDFSENLNDTFVFIRLNFKPLVTSFLGISGVFMLGSAIISGIYQSQVGEIFESIINGSNNTNDDFTPSIFSPTYFLVYLLAWLNVVAMKVSLLAFVKVYERKAGEDVTFKEVWHEFAKYFFKVFFYSIPIVLVILVGVVFCILPGAYLWVVLMPFEMALVVEEETFSGAWDRCFTIIKEHFWPSLAIYLVAYLIYMAATGIIGAVIGLISGVLAYFTTKDISTTVGIVTSVFNILSFVFFIVFYISAILNYFSLTESYDGTGMMRRLDNLGGTTTTHATEEEY
jgi:hypothetical protein